MEVEEVDLRSIEAGIEDDGLDAVLEREFLLQQEAKSRMMRASSISSAAAAAEEEEGEGSAFGFHPSLRTPGSSSEEGDGDGDVVEHFGARGKKRRRVGSQWEDVVELSAHLVRDESLGMRQSLFLGGSRPSTLSDLKFLNDAEVQGPTVRNDTKALLLPDFGGTDAMAAKKMKSLGLNFDRWGDGKISGLCEDTLQVPVRKEKEEFSSWLRLGLPSNPGKYSLSGKELVSKPYQPRKMTSGSSSKVSARTATSLERQYSTGSTSTVESPNFVAQEPYSLLTFSFPGWGVDISKGRKHPSVVSHHLADSPLETAGGAPKRLRESPDPPSRTADRGKAVEEDLGDRSPVFELPDEILLQVMRRLKVKDLCSSAQTCKRWYAIGLQNDLWEQLLGDVDGELLLCNSSSDVLPRWVCMKNSYLSENIRIRFNVFSKGYIFLRRALHEWWDNGLLSSRYPSKGIYSLIRKLTLNDWNLLYEALGVAFVDRTDRIASMLLRKLEPVALYSLAGSSSAFEVYWRGSVKEVSQREGMVGKELWVALLKTWHRYKGWLQLITTHCPDLNLEVMLERARSLNWAATPTIYNNGLICFRSQIVLRYGLRSVLQAGFMYLTTQDARDCTSQQDKDLLRSSHHLLQELDVTDDFTLPLTSHTQTKLRQCFRSALSTNSKLALHMNDRLYHL